MHLEISARELSVSDSLHTEVKQSVGKLASKYAADFEYCKIIFNRQKHMFSCELTVRYMHKDLHAKSEGRDVYGLIDKAVDKVSSQINSVRHKSFA